MFVGINNNYYISDDGISAQIRIVLAKNYFLLETIFHAKGKGLILKSIKYFSKKRRIRCLTGF